MAKKLNYMILPRHEGGLYKYRIVLDDEIKSSDFLNKEDLRRWLKVMHEGGLYLDYEDLAPYPVAGREEEDERED